MAAVFLCAAISNSAQAAPILGSGAMSCGKWLANRTGDGLVHQELHFSEKQWVLGWLSAASVYNVRASGLRETDADAVTAWVDKYCGEHPLDLIAAAADSLVDELSKTK
jgi:hypothetical protein